MAAFEEITLLLVGLEFDQVDAIIATDKNREESFPSFTDRHADTALVRIVDRVVEVERGVDEVGEEHVARQRGELDAGEYMVG